MAKKHSIFAVHKWETSTGKHDVTTFYPSGYNKTKKFEKWSGAERYAKSEAKRLKLLSYQVDTPQRSHVHVKVK